MFGTRSWLSSPAYRGWFALAMLTGGLSLATNTAMACDTSWISVSGGDWFAPGNWSNGVPGITTNACIAGNPGVFFPVTLNQSGNAANLTLGSAVSIAVADGATLSLSGNSLNNAGTIELSSTGIGTSQLALASDTTINGGGQINLNINNTGAPSLTSIVASGGTLTNVDNAIVGAGHIGNGATFDIVNGAGPSGNGIGGGSFTSQQSQTLFIDNQGSFTNGGMLKADGGTLVLASTVNLTNFSANTLTGGIYLADQGGVIQLNSVVAGGGGIIHNAANIQISGLNSQILDSGGNNALSTLMDNQTGGSFEILGQATFQVNDGFTNDGQIFVGDGGTLNMTGSISSNLGAGTINVTSSLGGIAEIYLNGNATWNGQEVDMFDATHSGSAIITGADGVTLDNVGNIIGEGRIGAGAVLNIINDNTIRSNNGLGFSVVPNTNANLQIDSRGAFTNNGLVEAAAGDLIIHSNVTNFDAVTGTLNGGDWISSGGILRIDSLGLAPGGGELIHNNAQIALIGPNSMIVDANGNDALTNFRDNQAGGYFAIGGGRNFEIGSSFNNAGAIVVFDGSTLTVSGTINNSGSLQLLPEDNSAQLFVQSDTVLTGGGVVLLSGAPVVFPSGGPPFQEAGVGIIYGANGATLVNLDNTIQGVGHIGNGSAMNIINAAGGTIQAQFQGERGNTLTIDPNGAFTNLGKLLVDPNAVMTIEASGAFTNTCSVQVSAGGTLHVESELTNYTAATGTLTGGTYKAVDGTIQIDVLGGAGNASGNEIIHNAATIELSGAGAQIVDASNNNALANFHDNLAGGSFTIDDGSNFTSPDGTDFTNAGNVMVGAGSTFTTGAGANYTQTAGTTEVNGVMNVGGVINILGGAFVGTGTINGSINLGADGSMAPGDDPGAVTINGDLDISGKLIAEIAGSSASGDFGAALVSGSVILRASSFFDIFFDITLPSNPGFLDSYDLLHAGGGLTGTFGTVDVTGLTAGDTYALRYTADDVFLDIDGPSQSAVPEPAEFLPALGIAMALAARKLRSLWDYRR